MNNFNGKEVRAQLETLLKLRRELWDAQAEVGRIATLGRAEQKKFDRLLLGKSK